MGGATKVVFAFTVVGDRITAVDLLSDAATIAALDITPL
jgi:hypothetical protein